MNRSPNAPIRVGFILLPRFTITAFAGFLDVLRLAGDEGDRSGQRRFLWSVLGKKGELIESSAGIEIAASGDYAAAESYDYVVVVGGLLHGGQKIPPRVLPFLRRAAAAGVTLVGLCTGSFALARAGLLDGYIVCVSWFHRDDFQRDFPACKVISNQMYVVDRDRYTCAGGTSVAHLAAYVVERSLNRASAVKALRIMIERQPLPPRTLQPENLLADSGSDSIVRRAMLIIEQRLSAPLDVESLAKSLQIGRRQLERRFQRDIGVTPREYRLRLRMERSRWLLEHTDMQVAEIALECGFYSSAHFGRVVRRSFGRAPLELRAGREKMR